MRRVTIPTLGVRVVPDEFGACPRCGAYWGHPDEALNFPNRSKVDNFWKCYNPRCTCGFYDPDRGVVVETKAHEDDAEGKAREAASRAEIVARVQAQLEGKTWVEVSPNCWQAK